jgi:drug/metabolite transporter (DMT)-like permease
MGEHRPTPQSNIAVAEAALLLVVFIWGANFSFIKLALREIPPFAFAGLRFTIGSVVMLGLLWLREGSVGWPPGSGLRLFGLGVLGNTIYQALFMIGMTRTSVANAALLVATTPVLVMALGRLTGIERLTRSAMFGIALAFSGVCVVLAGRGAGADRATLVGDLAILASAGCWATYTLGVRALHLPMSNLRLTALTTLAGTPGLVLLGLPAFFRTDWAAISAKAWGGTAYTIFLGLILAYAIWNHGIRLVGSSRTAAFGSGVPVVAMLLAWPLLGERPTAWQLGGAVLVATGVLLSRRK